MNAPESHVSLLHRISGIVSSSLTLEQMLQELVGLAARITNSDACLVYLVDHEGAEIVLRASQLPHEGEIGTLKLKMGEGITGWVAQHRSVVALDANAQADTRFKPFHSLPEDSYQAFVSVPLVSGGDLIGVINIHHKDSHTHTPDEIALLTFIGEQMGVVISRARFAEQSQNAVKRMETLAAVAQTIAGENYLDRILQAIAEMVAETLDSSACSLMLVDAERRAEKRYCYPDVAGKSGLASTFSVPLMVRDKVIGAINIHTRDERVFTEEEAGFVKAVAGQAAIAIENARLISETLEMKRALETRKVVERAKGILQSQHQLTEEEAYLRLRNESRRLRRPMRELAEAVILADDLNRKEEKRKTPELGQTA